MLNFQLFYSRMNLLPAVTANIIIENAIAFLHTESFTYIIFNNPYYR